MEELIVQLVEFIWSIIGGTSLAPYLGLVALVAFLLVHVVAVLPVSVTEKIPNWLMILLNSIAGNYKHASNHVSDIKGNPK